jgi:aminoglycoside phosphotransferase (APT) family kinase protein
LRTILGLGDLSSVELLATGWHRYAVLARDRVVLLPRSRRWVPGMAREAAALQLLEWYGVPAPRLLARIEDEELWSEPVTIISRYDGAPWAQRESSADARSWQAMLAELAELIATCHAIPETAVPAELRSPAPPSPEPLERRLWHVQDYLEPGRLEQVARRLAVAAEVPAHRVDTWMTTVQPCLGLSPTFAHRDINEGQIMINSAGRVTGLIDWESAGIQHPLNDLDFSTWGSGVWELEEHHDRLRRDFWDAYAAVRGVALPDWPAIQLFMIIVGAPPPEGHTTAWSPARRDRTIANLRTVDAIV